VRARYLALAAAAALGGCAFAGLAGTVRTCEIPGLDRGLLLAFRTPGHPDAFPGPRWVLESARDITALGGFTVLALVSILAVAWLIGQGRRRQALVFGVTVILAQALSEVLKAWIDRPRPTLVSRLDLVYSSSFPSGHALMTPVVYLTLACVLAQGRRRPGEGKWLFGPAILLTIAVGLSRLVLGVHWPTDVLAGWCLGGAIAMAAALVLQVGPRLNPVGPASGD